MISSFRYDFNKGMIVIVGDEDQAVIGVDDACKAAEAMPIVIHIL